MEQKSHITNHMSKNILISMSLVMFGIFYRTYVYAQTTTSGNETAHSSTTSKPSYPLTIPNVGTCDSWASCRRLCADPVNTSNCRLWALSQGVIKPLPDEPKVLSEAKLQLGCNSKAECQSYCQIEANRDTCDRFARSARLGGGYDTQAKKLRESISNGQQVEKTAIIAEELKSLKCPYISPSISPSHGSCGLIVACAQSENSHVCSQIAAKIGLTGGEIVQNGPGGCTTREGCTLYCQDKSHALECKRPQNPNSETGSTNGKSFDQNLRPAPRDKNATPSTKVQDDGVDSNVRDGFKDRRLPSPKADNPTQVPQKEFERSRAESGGLRSVGVVEPTKFKPPSLNDLPKTTEKNSTLSPTPQTKSVLGASDQKIQRVPPETPWNDFWRLVFWQ